jgi:hypothetical protein
VIKRISRRVWLAAVLAALSVVRIPPAEGEGDATVSAPLSRPVPTGSLRERDVPLGKGYLSADKKRVVVGETLHLLLTINGGEGLRAAAFEQPRLPALAHLDLLTVGQRNELAFRSGGRVFSTTFLYTLKARSPGVENIPPVQVKYRDKGEGESRAITVAGLEIEIVEGRSIGRRKIALVVLVVAGGALVLVAWRMRSRGKEQLG